MFTGGSIEVDVTGESSGAASARRGDASDVDWKWLHDKLRSFARRRRELEAEELGFLLEAEDTRLYRRLGYATMREYMERELDYSVHAANERLRVARDLQELPLLAEELRTGELSFSAVRELTRVSTPETEHAFIEAALGKTAGQVQKLVSGLRRGALPGDPPDPKLVKHKLFLELEGEVFALWRRMRVALEDELGSRMTDSELVKAVCRRALEPAGEKASAKPPVQQGVTTCKVCKRAWASGAGVVAELTPAQAAAALCDAEYIGDLESSELTRPTSTIPAAIRRKVLLAHGHACAVPGCRSTRNIDLHHLRFRQHGGGHHVWNVIPLCSAHHLRLHEGKLVIRGRAPDDLVFAWRDDEGAERVFDAPEGKDGPTWDWDDAASTEQERLSTAEARMLPPPVQPAHVNQGGGNPSG